jgi:F420-non-reducing hydrogenase small subunit
VAKPKLAIYWAASCGGCDIAILDIEDKILQVSDFFDIVFWPVALDFKYDDVRRMADGEITLTLFNGAIRSSENYEIARLLRQKSAVLVAFGSCAQDGAIPSLANLFSKEEIFDYVYRKSPSLDNGNGVIPQPSVRVAEGELHIPELWNTVRSLDQVVEVDYYIPGCPPQSDQILKAVLAVIDILQNGKPLPPKGTVLGAGEKCCCDECTRERDVKKIRKFVRPFEIEVDPKVCLLEQGLVCMGPATRSGCGAKCVSAGIPCRGCYGRPLNVRDQGAKMASALASVIDSNDPEEVDQIVATIPDPVGTFYRFSLATSSLRRTQR